MKEKHEQSLPTLEKLKQNEQYTVWFGLKDPDGNPIGEKILNEFISNPLNDEVIITGIPGVGKTTAIKQLRALLEEDAVQSEMKKARGLNQLEKIPITTIFLDDVLDRFLEEMDYYPAVSTLGYWNDTICDLFSEYFSGVIERNKKEGNILLVELIPRRTTRKDEYGKDETLNIMYSTFQKEIQREGTLVLGVAGDPRVQEKATSLRMFASSLRDPKNPNALIRTEGIPGIDAIVLRDLRRDFDITSEEIGELHNALTKLDDYEWLRTVFALRYGVKFVWRFHEKPSDPTEAAIKILDIISLSAKPNGIKKIMEEVDINVKRYLEDEQKIFDLPDLPPIEDFPALNSLKEEPYDYERYQKNIYYILNFLMEISCNISENNGGPVDQEEIEKRFFIILNNLNPKAVSFFI